ncbi:hypothetical protein L9F63_022238 [Diploptera punctata]|uniref:Ionotropic glutamate receptor C-terminal domain-containing protein n=1 Tax=Diploptera punctata TaxID=6984 RepID=A0AAD7ZN15_DIPPU|nr:hypothetical protein L9F63_022238 [Diploptera punctata]
MSKILIIIFLVQIATSSLIQNEVESSLETGMLECLLIITETYLLKEKSIAVMVPDLKRNSSNIQDDFAFRVLKELHLSTNVSFIIPTERVSPIYKSVVKPDSVIMTINGKVLSYQRRELYILFLRLRQNMWNSRARFIIVSLWNPTSANAQHLLAKTFLNVAWSFHVKNVIILSFKFTKNLSFPSTIDIYTWFPYKNKRSCNINIADVKIVDNWNPDTKQFLCGANLFPPKELNNFGGCNFSMLLAETPPLAISTKAGEVSGLDVNIIETIGNISNFKVVFRDTSSKQVSKVYDIIGSSWVSNVQFSFEWIYPYVKEKIIWVVPAGNPYPSWMSLIRIFNMTLWVLVGTSFILVSLTFWVLRTISDSIRIKDEKHVRTNCLSFGFETLRFYLGTSAILKTEERLISFFLMIVLIYCMQVNTAYQSSLIGFLVNPGQQPPIQNTNELRKSGIALRSAVFSTKQGETMDWKSNVKNFVENCTVFECLKRVVFDRDVAFLSRKTAVDYVGMSDYWSNGKPLFAELKSAVNEGFLSIHVQNGNLLLRRINKLVFRLRSAGIIDKWNRDIEYYNKKQIVCDAAQFLKKLSLTHFAGAFLIMFLGFVISTLCFIIEVSRHFKNLV